MESQGSPNTETYQEVKARRYWGQLFGVLLMVSVAVAAWQGYASASRQARCVEQLRAAVNESGLTLIENGKASLALQLFDKMVELDPTDIYALNNRSLALNRLGRYKEALEAAEQVLRIQPDCMAALGNRAEARRGLGR